MIDTPYRHPEPGTEFDWLAVDSEGYVGVFFSGGEGPVPRAVAANLEIVDLGIERLPSVPVESDAEGVQSSGDDWWSDPATRGLYGYEFDGDADDKTRSYVRLKVPAKPLHLDQIEDETVRAAASLVILGVAFSTMTEFTCDGLGVRLYGDTDARIVAELNRRDGRPTTVVMRSGATYVSWNIAWGYDIHDEWAHITTNISPGAAGRAVDFFFTSDVARLEDAESGRVLLDVEGETSAEVSREDV